MTDAREHWLAEADAWARDTLAALVGASVTHQEIVRERAWSLVARVDTDRGAFFFKACAAGGAHEAALLEYLSGRWAQVVPTPVAVDRDAGRVLLPDCGVPARSHVQGDGALALWKELLPEYAAIQIASCADCEQLLAAGVPDRRLARLPLLLGELLGDAAWLDAPGGLSAAERDAMLRAVPRLQQQCARLAAARVPEGLDHGDLHDGNVLVDADRAWLVDWADSSVTHPFCSLFVTLDVMQSGGTDPASDDAVALRDAYLAAWEQLAPRSVLEDAYRVALHVGQVVRALDWQRMLAGAPDDQRARFAPHLAGCLRRWYERSP